MFETDQTELWSYGYYAASQIGPINGSGILQNPASTFEIYTYCEGDNDASIALDNVQWSIFGTATGTNPIVPQPTQVLVNNDFSSGSLDPWTTSSTTGRADVGVINGQATMTFTRLSTTYTSPTWIMQTIPQAQRGQTYTVTADVYVNIFGNTNCVAQISAGNAIFTSPTVTTSQHYPLNIQGTLGSDTTYFYLYGSCTGNSGSTNVAFDNVYFTLNT